MRDFFEDGDDPANDSMHEVRMQAMADMVDASDMIENGGPLREILLRAFGEAKDALIELVNAQTEDTAIRALQWKVRRYDDLVTWTRDIINNGREAAQELDEGAREAILNIVRGEDHDDTD